MIVASGIMSCGFDEPEATEPQTKRYVAIHRANASRNGVGSVWSALQQASKPTPRMPLVEALKHPDRKRELANRGEESLAVRMDTETGEIGNRSWKLDRRKEFLLAGSDRHRT